MYKNDFKILNCSYCGNGNDEMRFCKSCIKIFCKNKDCICNLSHIKEHKLKCNHKKWLIYKGDYDERRNICVIDGNISSEQKELLNKIDGEGIFRDYGVEELMYFNTFDEFLSLLLWEKKCEYFNIKEYFCWKD